MSQDFAPHFEAKSKGNNSLVEIVPLNSIQKLVRAGTAVSRVVRVATSTDQSAGLSHSVAMIFVQSKERDPLRPKKHRMDHSNHLAL